MRGFVNDFVVFITPVLVIVAAVQRDMLSCACAQGLVAVAAVQRDVLSCTCTQGLVAIAVVQRNMLFCLRTRPGHRCRRAMQRVVVRLHTRPC